MVRTIRFAHCVLAGAVLSALSFVGTASAATVTYCKTVGVPKGCVTRPVAPVVVVPAPVVVVPAPVVVVPRTVVVAPRTVVVPRAVVVPGYVGNRGGPVNRVGRR